MRLNREQFRKWIKALKSGRYKQTTGTLNDKDGYCCLGVACKILIPKNKWKYQTKMDENTGEETEIPYLEGDMPNYQKYAPTWLKEINDDIQKRREDGNSLDVLNDTEKYNFKEIAKALEEAYPERKKKTKILVKKKK